MAHKYMDCFVLEATSISTLINSSKDIAKTDAGSSFSSLHISPLRLQQEKNKNITVSIAVVFNGFIFLIRGNYPRLKV